MDGRPLHPSKLPIPAFLLNFPFSYCTDIPNNKWMEEYTSDENRKVDFAKASLQWMELYGELAADGLVYILPTPPNARHLQDLVFVGNLGIVLHHLDTPTVLLSNFKSQPRLGEESVGAAFFTLMGYNTELCKYHWEGEAELKHLRDNIYIGGYGQRSDPESYSWMAEKFDMSIVQLEMVEEYFYHLDCTIFPITKEHVLACTKMFKRRELNQLKKVAEVISVSEADCYQGITNVVRIGNTILSASNLNELNRNSEEYKLERDKNRHLEDIAADLALEVYFINLSEYLKGGAVLSCMVMHLNRYSFEFSLL